MWRLVLVKQLLRRTVAARSSADSREGQEVGLSPLEFVRVSVLLCESWGALAETGSLGDEGASAQALWEMHRQL
eukprot:COSAG01_NODE_2799_length_7053_cov_21.482456_8_plen_74_part_00